MAGRIVLDDAAMRNRGPVRAASHIPSREVIRAARTRRKARYVADVYNTLGNDGFDEPPSEFETSGQPRTGWKEQS
jgi:hypothetical protein